VNHIIDIVQRRESQPQPRPKSRFVRPHFFGEPARMLGVWRGHEGVEVTYPERFKLQICAAGLATLVWLA
jgi:hypothetical protein